MARFEENRGIVRASILPRIVSLGISEEDVEPIIRGLDLAYRRDLMRSDILEFLDEKYKVGKGRFLPSDARPGLGTMTESKGFLRNNFVYEVVARYRDPVSNDIYEVPLRIGSDDLLTRGEIEDQAQEILDRMSDEVEAYYQPGGMRFHRFYRTPTFLSGLVLEELYFSHGKYLPAALSQLLSR